MYDIILASGSPRRQEILKNIGLSFRVKKSDADESMEDGIAPSLSAMKLSLLKATDVAKNEGSDSLVIGADTIVVSPDGEILGKPKNEDDAKKMLKMLSGKKHSVITGVSVMRTFDAKATSFFVSTDVYFKELTETEIMWYLATKEPFDKAGAYGIQGLGAILIEKIEGDYFNVVGLPVSKLVDVLREEFDFKLI
ncbi:MAG: septum formation inhibitor Maf [Clostridia bacterium]|nr:septum formation inhibitor Maf [Clostridia bacterium]